MRVIKFWISLVLSVLLSPLMAQTDFLFTDAVKPDSFAVAFNLRDSLIEIHAAVNGKSERFILDNGCPYLVVNSRRLQAVSPDTSIRARGIGGAVTAGRVYIDSFNWSGLQKHRFRAIAADLPHLGDSICGLIGLDLIKDYRVVFDFGNRTLWFKKTDRGSPLQGDTARVKAIPFTWSGHLPVVRALIEADTLLCGIDCGASQNLLAAGVMASAKGLTGLKKNILRGAGGATILVMEGYLKEMTIAGRAYPGMKFSFDDVSLNQINQGRNPALRGLLGIPFLKHYQTAIDFPNQRLELEVVGK